MFVQQEQYGKYVISNSVNYLNQSSSFDLFGKELSKKLKVIGQSLSKKQLSLSDAHWIDKMKGVKYYL